MAGHGLDGLREERKTKPRRRPGRPAESAPAPVSVSLFRSGEWLPADELRAQALEAVHANTDVTLDLAEVDHLDAIALQILLALADDRRRKGLHLHLVNASPLLRQWFEFAGAPAHLSPTLAGQP